MNDVVIEVHVVPRASRAGLAGMRGEAWLVRLSAPPVEGAANQELIALLASALRVPKRSVTIVSGARGRRKRLRVAGVDPKVLRDLRAFMMECRT